MISGSRGSSPFLSYFSTCETVATRADSLIDKSTHWSLSRALSSYAVKRRGLQKVPVVVGDSEGGPQGAPVEQDDRDGGDVHSYAEPPEEDQTSPELRPKQTRGLGLNWPFAKNSKRTRSLHLNRSLAKNLNPCPNRLSAMCLIRQ